MSSHLPATHSTIVERQSRFDAVLGELAQLASQGPSASEFYWRLLESIGREVAASAGAVYEDAGSRPMPLLARIGDEADLADATRAIIGGHVETGGPQGTCRWEGRCLLAAVCRDAVPVAWLGLEFERDLAFEAKGGIERFVAAVAEVASSYEIRNHIQRVQRNLSDREALLKLWHLVEEIPNPDEAAWRFVNDARRVMGCDRFAILIKEGRRSRFWKLSDLARPDRHSDYVRQAEELASKVPDGVFEAWVGVAGIEPPAPPLDRLLSEQSAVSGARSSGLLNLGEKRKGIEEGNAVLLIENFDAPLGVEDVVRISELRSDLELVVGTLIERKLRQSFAGRLLRPFHRLGFSRSVVWALAIVACALVLLIPVPFTVVARGELLPASRREIFAPADGVVRQLAVRHNQSVEAGGLLAVLDSAELEAERSRLRGLLSAAQEEFNAAELARVGDVPTPPRGDWRTEKPAALAEELRIRRDSLRQQLDLVERQLDEMTLRSPIEGTVITFSLQNRLESRPVRRGQSLLQVADLDQDWELRLRVPEQDAGYVLDASGGGKQSLKIKFLVTSDPAKTFETQLTSIALVTHRDRDAESVVNATAFVPKGEIERPRPGASVIAKVDCGRRSLGFVWFHEVVNAVRSRLFL